MLSTDVGYGQLQLHTVVNHHVFVFQTQSGHDDTLKQNSSPVSNRTDVLRPHAITKLDETTLVISNPIPRLFLVKLLYEYK